MLNEEDILAIRQQYSVYADQILTELGLSGLSQPLRGRVLAAVEQYITQVTLNTILKNLDDDTAERIDEMLQKESDQEELLLYLVSSMPNIEQAISEAVNASYANLRDSARTIAGALVTDQPGNTVVDELNVGGDIEGLDNSKDTIPDDKLGEAPAPVPSGIDENPLPTSSTDSDGSAAEAPPSL